MIRSFLGFFTLTRMQWALVSLAAVYLTVIAPINVYFADEIMKFFGLENASIRESPAKFLGMLISWPPIILLIFMSKFLSEAIIFYFNIENKIENWMLLISYIFLFIMLFIMTHFLDSQFSQNLEFFAEMMPFLDISKIQQMTFFLSIYFLFYTFLLFFVLRFLILCTKFLIHFIIK